jgi:hypothetical protein
MRVMVTTRGRLHTLGSRQRSALIIALDTGGCVAGRGGDALWDVCRRLVVLGCFHRPRGRTCFELTPKGRYSAKQVAAHLDAIPAWTPAAQPGPASDQLSARTSP